jgi:flagellar assembly protein FliH
LPNIFKKFSQAKVEPYQFPNEENLIYEEPSVIEDEETPEPTEEGPSAPVDSNEGELEEKKEEERPEPKEPEPKPKTPIDFASVQADQILREARRQADEILARAAQEAEAQAQAARDAAREDGYQAGYAQGAADAAQEGKRQREAQAAALEADVKKFLEQANTALERQMEEREEDLKELAMTVAEKVVCVSLKSSSEVISRMIQTAIDKRKHKEWVRIYISECDAKSLTEIPPSLASALSALSDRVRIIPVAEDEPGTCIIEMPDEIVDASASTQLNNLRGIITDSHSMSGAVNLR